jgi:hypothetical protein
LPVNFSATDFGNNPAFPSVPFSQAPIISLPFPLEVPGNFLAFCNTVKSSPFATIFDKSSPNSSKISGSVFSIKF